MEKTHVQPPVIVDLGKRKKKVINDLKNGCGKLMTEVDIAVEHARSTLPDADKNKAVIPVVIIYSKKKKRKGSGSLPFSPLNPLSLLRL
jgi:Family of unknown function (DUF6200)